jgi:hypothetical protein
VQGSLHFADALIRAHSYEGAYRRDKRVGSTPRSNDATDVAFRSYHDEHLPAGQRRVHQGFVPALAFRKELEVR